jgi:hypothetical protein
MTRVSSPWTSTGRSQAAIRQSQSRARGLVAEHEAFRRHFEVQPQKSTPLICSEHHAVVDGLECAWKAWSATPKTLLLAERAHEAACPARYCSVHGREHGEGHRTVAEWPKDMI